MRAQLRQFHQSLSQRQDTLLSIYGIIAIVILCFAAPAPGFAQACPQQAITTTPAARTGVDKYELCRQQSYAAGRADNVDLILIGDSLAQAWDRGLFPPHMKTLNLGFGGDKTQNVLWRLELAEWTGIRTGLVFIMLGTNNLLSDPACAIIAGLKQVIVRAQSTWPMAQIVVLDIAPLGEGFIAFEDSRTEVNAAINQLADIKTINVDEEMTCGRKTPCANYAPDNVHFSAAGYGVLWKHLMQLERGN